MAMLRNAVPSSLLLSGGVVAMDSPSVVVAAEEENEGEPSEGPTCGPSWDFTKGAQKSHSSRTSRIGWEHVDEHYNIAYAHDAWGGKHTLDVSAHTACPS